MGTSHSPTMRLSSLPLFLCLLVCVSGTFRNKEKRVKEGGKKEEGGGCFEVYHTEEQVQYRDVCEQSSREVCGTEYSQECHDEPTTRLEEQCETSVVSEPVKVCTPGEAHKVCQTTNVESFREECSTSFTTQCERGGRRGRPSRKEKQGKRGKRAPQLLQAALLISALQQQEPNEEPQEPRRPRCFRVPHRNCHQFPVSTPREVCHTEQDPAICHEEQKEKTVRSCKPVEVPSSHKGCKQVPHRACHQEPYQSCRKVPSTVPVKVPRQVCL